MSSDTTLSNIYEGILLPKKFDKKLIHEAFSFADRAHKGQKRKNGDPYIIHPLSVARILLELGMDDKMAAAGLLHDVIEDTKETEETIAEKFGPDIAKMVVSVTNLGRVDFSAYSTPEEAEKAEIEQKNKNLRQLFLSMADDVRVVIIKLADRLHNMRTLKALPKEDQVRIARESLNIFSPLALRLGMGEIKGQLEDLAFPIAYPEEYKLLKKEANRRYKAADRYVLRAERAIEDKLKEEGVRAKIEGRSKHIYSLYKKITRPEIDWDFDKIYDLVALRIITKDVVDCYRILGIIHGIFRPLPNYIRDYIAAPKPNGYRSIHTSVFGPDAKIIEIQIRTEAMHEEAEFGVASHIHYTQVKESGATHTELKEGRYFAKESQTDFLKQIKKWQEGEIEGEDFMKGLRGEFLDDRIYVFSPNGDIYDLPQNATPVDFAYEVHSKVGDACTGAKVNGRIVPLDYPLSTRDVIQVISQKKTAPKRGWLDFVKTAKAKQHIRSYFRKFDFDKNLLDGKEIIAEELEILGVDLAKITEADLKRAVSETHFKSIDDLYAGVGAGLVTPRQGVKMLLGRTYIPDNRKKATKHVPARPGPRITGMKAQKSPCCKPGEGDETVCYITRGKGLTVHKKGCKNLRSLEPERLVKYNPYKKERALVQFEIVGKDRVGFIRDVTNVISENRMNIEKMKNAHRKKSDTSVLNVSVYVHELSECTQVLKKIKEVSDVVSVRRV